MGPVKDILHIIHGPIGCAYFTWGMRRNLMKAEEGQDNFGAYCFSTDVKETDIVFGSEKKLAGAIREAYSIFKPGCIAVFAICPIGLIGDDIESVCKKAEEDLKIKVIPLRCEGYRGVSQSAGHHIASNALMEHLVGTEEMEEDPGPFAVNVFGEYNIGGDYWVVKDLLERIGYNPISSFTGDSRVEEIQSAHKAKLNLVQCSGSMTYLAKKMDEKYGIPYRRVGFFRIGDISSALRTTAEFFEDPEMMGRAEEIIARETARIAPEIEGHRSRVAGKKAAIYMGGAAKAVSLVRAFGEIGMDVVIIGTQTGSRDDYKKISYMIILGTPLSYLNARFDYPGKEIADSLIELPVVMPPMVGGIALLMAFGRMGVLGQHLHSWGVNIAFTTVAVVVAQIFVSMPFYLRQARTSFEDVDLALENAGRTLGASRTSVFFSVTLTIAANGLISGAIMAFARALGEFGATIMFAGNFQGRT